MCTDIVKMNTIHQELLLLLPKSINNSDELIIHLDHKVYISWAGPAPSRARQSCAYVSSFFRILLMSVLMQDTLYPNGILKFPNPIPMLQNSILPSTRSAYFLFRLRWCSCTNMFLFIPWVGTVNQIAKKTNKFRLRGNILRKDGNNTRLGKAM